LKYRIPVLALALCVATANAEDKALEALAAKDAAGATSITETSAEDALPAALRENTYFYQSFGTTDPFRSLLAGDFVPKLQELVDLHTVKMVGVIWEPDDIAAILQDAQGYGYTLRPGDGVKNGSVVSVTQDALVARLNIFGQTTQLTLRLQHEE
jgi:Tfp pilus assembly protein PilP